MKRKILISGLLLQSCLAVFSQQDTVTKILDEVVLTSQRKAQKSFYIPYSVESVSNTTLNNYYPRTTPEALIGVNGVFVQKTNHGGGSPFIRGLTGNQSLILIDGIRLNNSTFRYGPNQYLNTIDAFTIDKIEVAKGTGSVQYGTDALGGVVQLFTKEPQFSNTGSKWLGKVLGKYMTGDMEKTVRGEGVYQGQHVAAQVGATYRNFGDLIGGDTTGKQLPSGYKEFAFDAKTKFRIKDAFDVTLAHQFLQQQHVPVYHKVVLENFAVNEMDPQQRMLTYAKVNRQAHNKFFQQIEAIASWQQTIEGRNSRKNGSSTLSKEKDEVNTLGFTFDVASQFSNAWSANTGIELYADKVNSTRENVLMQSGSKTAVRGLYPDAATYHNYSTYSLHHIQLNKWSVEGGIRFNTFAITINDTSLGKVKITPSSFVYNGAIMYNLSRLHHVYASYSSGYRAPNIDDMGTLGIVDFRYEVPAADLRPEQSRNTEIGYKFNTSKWSGTAAVYYMHLTNLIARIKMQDQVISGYPVYAKENVEDAYIKGFETEVSYELTKDLKLTGSLAYTYGQNLAKHEPLRRMPPLNGRVIANYQKQKWFAAAELLFASKQSRLAQGDKDDNRIPAGGTPGWNVANLYAGYTTSIFRFNMSFQNLLNKDYRTHGSGINGVGRSAWLTVVVQL